METAVLHRGRAIVIIHSASSGTWLIRSGETYQAAPGSGWWTAFYPNDNMQLTPQVTLRRLWSVVLLSGQKTVMKWNVGCERVPRPRSNPAGKIHLRETIEQPGAAWTLQCRRITFASNATHWCAPYKNPIEGKYYGWPVRFEVGKKSSGLTGSWKSTSSGPQSFTHFADGTAHKNRMQE